MDERIDAFGKLNLSGMVLVLMDDRDVGLGSAMKTGQSQYYHIVALLRKPLLLPESLNSRCAHQPVPLESLIQFFLVHPLVCVTFE